jgi:hypothetical protein
MMIVRFALEGQSGYIPVAYVELIKENESGGAEVQWDSSCSYAADDISEQQLPADEMQELAVESQWNESEELQEDHNILPTISTEECVEAALDDDYAVALYDYVGASSEEISFKEGKFELVNAFLALMNVH